MNFNDEQNPFVAVQIGEHVSYDAIVATFGEVLVSHDEGSYQGVSWYLIRREDQVGFLVNSWGSCSGCDCLEAARRNINDVQEVADAMWRAVRWFDSVPAMLTFFDAESIEPKSHWWHEDGRDSFIMKVCAYKEHEL